MKINIKKLKEIIRLIKEEYSVEPFDGCSINDFLCADEGLKILNKSETKVDDLRIIEKLVPIRCGELTPIESSGYTLIEIGNEINIESGKIW